MFDQEPVKSLVLSQSKVIIRPRPQLFLHLPQSVLGSFRAGALAQLGASSSSVPRDPAPRRPWTWPGPSEAALPPSPDPIPCPLP